MSTKPTKRRTAATVKFKDRAELDGVLFDLLKQGRVIAVRSNKLPPHQLLWFAVPDELVAPAQVDEPILTEENTLLLHGRQMPERLQKRFDIHALAAWRGFVRLELRPLIQNIAGGPAAEAVKILAEREVDEAIRGLLSDALFDGFDMALERYAEQLKNVPEVVAWRRTRRNALERGRTTQSQAREAKYQRIRDTWAQLEAEGKPCTYDAVAAACKCSRSTVDRAINNRPTKRPKR